MIISIFIVLKVVDDTRIHPTHSYIDERNEFSVFCNSSTPPVWYFEEETIHFDDRKMSLGKYLHIKAVTFADDGNYDCEGTNECNEIFNARSRLEVTGKSLTVNLCSKYLFPYYFMIIYM